MKFVMFFGLVLFGFVFGVMSSGLRLRGTGRGGIWLRGWCRIMIAGLICWRCEGER